MAWASPAALELAEKELTRQRSLARRGTVSKASVDAQERDALVQRQSVQSLRNSMNLLPAERRVLEAQLARYQSQLITASRDLARTAIVLPFDARIDASSVEPAQFVSTGQTLLVADGTAIAKVSAQLPIRQLRGLIPSQATQPRNLGDDVAKILGFKAQVRLPEAELAWPGRFTGMSATVDPKTRAVGVIVEVDGPYRGANPGKRPPLVKGMLVEVLLEGRPRAPAIVVPRTAIHGQAVYVIDAANRLRRKPVTIDLVQPEFVVLGAGLDSGERIVILELTPAIEGILLEPVDDVEALAALKRLAGGTLE